MGEMESGLAAQILGVPLAIVSGGLGCVVAAGAVIKKFPQLWAYEGDETFQGALDKKIGSISYD